MVDSSLEFSPVPPAPEPAARRHFAPAGGVAPLLSWLADALPSVTTAASLAPQVIVLRGAVDLIAARTPNSTDPLPPEQPAGAANASATPAAALPDVWMNAAAQDIVAVHDADIRAVGENGGVRPALSTHVAGADALSRATLESAVRRGQELADQHADSGYGLLLPALHGTGQEIVCRAVIGSLTRTEPSLLVPDHAPAGGWDAAALARWQLEVEQIRGLMFRVRTDLADPLTLLRAIGSPQLAASVGLIAQAAARRTPVFLSGPETLAAALLADRIAPGTRGWIRLADTHDSVVETKAAEDLGLVPVLRLGISAPEPTGSLLVLRVLLPLIAAAADSA